MHDIKRIREHPDQFDLFLQKRHLEPQAEIILSLDQKLRSILAEKQELETQRNKYSKEIGRLKAQGNEEAFQQVRQKVSGLKAEIAKKEEAQEACQQNLHNILSCLPNRLEEDVPIGEDETENLEIRKWGKKRAFEFIPKAHYDLGEELNMLDFEQASKISGARFAVLKNGLAKLERALIQFMLDLHIEQFGYQEISPPYLVRPSSLYGTGQLPKFKEDLFETTDQLWLIPTAEVPLTNMVRESLLAEEELPLRFASYAPCFRSEAGAAGKDTRGLIRMHQFPKVELVSITKPEESRQELERMTECVEQVLKRLNLPYQVIVLCSGDTGFSARKTYDIEVWLPESKQYREISSCSNCGDFQARRMQARYRKKASSVKPDYVHTLNGSALAVGRTMVAILENYQLKDGSIEIPEVLRPFMNGMEKITKHDKSLS